MDFVDNRLDPNTGTMRGRAILANPNKYLTPGLFGRLRLPGSGKYQAVLVPDAAIGSDQAEKFILIVGPDKKVKRQAVELGPRSHGLRVIRKGLAGDEQIIVRGIQRVRPGSDVTTEVEELKAVSSDGLPDEYVPVPEDQWLRVPRTSHDDESPRAMEDEIDEPPAETDATPVIPATSSGEGEGNAP